jgi:competence protein ComEC
MPVSRPAFMARLLPAYVFGMLAIMWLPLPSLSHCIAIGVVGAVLSGARRVPWVAGALLGLAVSALAAHDALGHRIAACVDGAALELRGTVVGLPKVSLPQTQVDVAPDAIAQWPECAGPPPRRLRLSWFDAPALIPGERWQLRIKLRSVRGFQNPVGFDYEAWSLAAGIDGGGSVRYGERGESASDWNWDRLRLALRERYAALPLDHGGIDLALLTGDAGLMDEADWSLFRATGTVHLMVISGLHLTIVATLGVVLGRAAARLMPPVLVRNGMTWAGAVAGGVLVTLYACLAGWGVAVLRAWVATVLVLLILPLGRRVSLPRMFLLVAAIVLTCDPLSPLQAGFWLSFAAVAVLLGQFAPRIERSSAIRTLVAAQFVLAAGMVPVLTATIGSVAWVGPLANLMAVPIVSVVVVPLDLLAGVLVASDSPGAAWVAHLVDVLVGFVVAYLRALAQLDWTSWSSARTAPALIVSSIACGLMLLPLAWRHRLLLLPSIVLPLVPIETRPIDGEFAITVFDVGQGLSVLVDTAQHRLLYDAGPRFPSGFDLGAAVVVPNLRRDARRVLDTVVLSHADLDHVGGYGAVASATTVRTLLGGQPVAGFGDLRACRDGTGWQWDGVRFRIVHPGRAAASDNDSSCVLWIDNGRRRAMLPGDITTIGESALPYQSLDPPIDFLVAAHHGSRSSSGASFIAWARPRVVVFSAGFMNRFGHPHRDVVCRFASAGSRAFTTAQSGALTWHSDSPEAPVEWRRHVPPYWRVGASVDGVCSQR